MISLIYTFLLAYIIIFNELFVNAFNKALLKFKYSPHQFQTPLHSLRKNKKTSGLPSLHGLFFKHLQKNFVINCDLQAQKMFLPKYIIAISVSCVLHCKNSD